MRRTFVDPYSFARMDGKPTMAIDVTKRVGANIIDQQPWIDTRLANRSKGSHAFVLGHKNLIGQNHAVTFKVSKADGTPAVGVLVDFDNRPRTRTIVLQFMGE